MVLAFSVATVGSSRGEDLSASPGFWMTPEVQTPLAWYTSGAVGLGLAILSPLSASSAQQWVRVPHRHSLPGTAASTLNENATQPAIEPQMSQHSEAFAAVRGPEPSA